MDIQFKIHDLNSGVLEFPIPERQERRFGALGTELDTNEPFENKIVKFTVGYYISERPSGFVELFTKRLGWNREFFPVHYEAAFQFGFNAEEIEQRLLEIRQETEELCKADEIDEIYEKTYSDIRLLLHIINKTNPYIPMPDIDWAEDGSLNATWIDKKNVITMGVYGNDILHFTYYLEEKRQISSVCELSDKSLLNGVIQIVDNILQE